MIEHYSSILSPRINPIRIIMIIVNVFNLIIMDCQYYVVWGEGMNENKRLTLLRHSKIYILISL